MAKPRNPNHESFSIHSRVASIPKDLPKERSDGAGLAKWGALATLLLLIGGIAWGASYLAKDPHMARIDELRQQLAPENNLTDEQRREVFSEMRKESEQLSDDQRRELWRSREDDMMQRFEKRLDEYFAMSPEQQVAAIDKEIDESEKRSQEWAKRREEWEAKRAAEEASGAKKSTDGEARGSSRGGSGGPGGSSGRGGGPRGPRDDKSRAESRKRMLDRSSPEMRAKMAQYREDSDKRRTERGLPPSPRRF